MVSSSDSLFEMLQQLVPLALLLLSVLLLALLAVLAVLGGMLLFSLLHALLLLLRNECVRSLLKALHSDCFGSLLWQVDSESSESELQEPQELASLSLLMLDTDLGPSSKVGKLGKSFNGIVSVRLDWSKSGCTIRVAAANRSPAPLTHDAWVSGLRGGGHLRKNSYAE